MEIKEIVNKQLWENLIKDTPLTPFFQSWNFGEAQKRIGHDVYRFAVLENKKNLLAAQVFVIHARRGTFLHLRHGPVFNKFNQSAFLFLLSKLKSLAKKHKAIFIRISPLLPADSNEIHFFKKLGFRSAPVHNQDAENCLVLDLSQSLEEIWQNFRKTTRNLIRKAERLGVKIKQGKQEDLKTFFQLYRKTARRQHFVEHKGIKEEFLEMSKDNQIGLFLGFYQNTPLCASLIVFYGKQAVYHHSGSIKSNIPANYLLQWEVIKEAKRRGHKYYNFWGIAPEGKPKHPWQGLTLFKKGFGGKNIDFIHAQDLPTSPLYWLSYIYQKLWSIYRGY